jgi:hypothetical protein
LGITLNRNQIVAEIPVRMKEIFRRVLLLMSLIRPKNLFEMLFMAIEV